MKKKMTLISRLWFLAAFLAVVVAPASTVAAGAANTEQPVLKPGMTIVKSAPVQVSPPLRSLVPGKTGLRAQTQTPSAVLIYQDRQLVIPKTRTKKEAPEKTIKGMLAGASIVQNAPVGNAMPAATANFEGVGNLSGVLPPDTQGDIGWDPESGKKYYVQWVNLNFQIWDVTDPAAPVSVYGPAAGNTLWAGTGSICDSNNDGDPLTRFDALANRWVMSQFALGFPDNFHQCIAVSQTADPTGAWSLYDFKTSTVSFNDYGKLGVWPDGYYMTFNQFNGVTDAWAGAGVAAFERDKMLLGEPANMIYLDLGAVTTNYGGMLPSDLDGPPPAVGTPNYFMEWDDSSWGMGDAADTLRVWEFHTDWDVPANSTFGLNTSYDPNTKITTANVDPNMCNGSRNCISQPGTSVKLDAISDRLMYRLQYRNFGPYQTLVANHTVDATGTDHAGIHWLELRDSGTGFALQQEGVYAPDTDNRWMGSLAMDGSGNLALGYSVGSGATYPSIRYTGRLAADPPNVLPQGEASLIAGTGSQTSTSYRWGDYSMMAVDPTDSCTFWYTQEYYATTSSSGWQTRIGSFRFPSCTSAPTGFISGTVYDGSTPLAGVTVSTAGGNSTVTDATGHYALRLEAGTYEVTAAKYGYISGTVPGVVVTPPGITTQDFSLSVAPTSTVSGVVTDASTGWPLYARLDIHGYPAGSIYTDPVTGAYSVTMVNGSYTFTVSALSRGYTPAVLPLDVAGDATQDFALATDQVACNALGYQLVLGSNFSSDGFDTATAPAFPAGWSVVDVSGTAGNWTTKTASSHPTGIVPHSAANMAVFNSYTATTGSATRLQQTSGLDLSAAASGEVSFWMYHDIEYANSDSVQVQVSTDAGLTWHNAGLPVYRYDTTTGWAQARVNINAYTGAGMTDVRVGLLGTSAYGNDIHIDDMAVSTASACTPIASAGLVVGAVLDANTGLAIAKTQVTDGALNQATFLDNAKDANQPHSIFVIAEPAGTVDLTASALKYGTVLQSPTVVAGATIRQDFNLGSAVLAANPTSLTYTVTTVHPTAAQPLDLTNSGSLSAGFAVFATPGTWSGYAPTGPFAPNTRHTGPPHLNDVDTTNLRTTPPPPNVPLLPGGTVAASWATGLTAAWGIGYNTDAGDLWLGNISYAGGDDLDYRFTPAGVNTGETIDTAAWVASYAADMTYNPFSKTLWQVNVGGDNCIYELDPATKAATGNTICPPFGTSERGLAFDPLTNTYYAGSWNDGIINHFAPDGTMLASVDVGLLIAGLAFNPATGHLFVMVRATGQPDIYVLDTNTPNYDNLGGFYLTEGTTNVLQGNQGGLELDCNGDLWAVNKTTQMVYRAASGETGVCNWQSTWLSVTPSSGAVPAAGGANLTASVDATGLALGTYNAHLRVANNSPYGAVIVPVTLNVVTGYTVTYNGNTNSGGSAPVDAASPYIPGATVKVLGAGTLSKTNYTFSGWNTKADGSGTPYAAAATFTIGADTTLFAQWTPLPTYTVIYDGNTNSGGIAPTDAGSPYVTGTMVSVLGAGTLSKTGYSFTGWNTAVNGSGSDYTPGATFTIGGNTTLYAKWAPLPTYTVIYNGNTNSGGTAPTDAGSPYVTGTMVSVLGAGTLSKAGYSFTGWNTAANGSGTDYTPGATFTIGGNTTLYAKWAALPTYTVTYNGNTNTGGTNPTDGGRYLAGATVTVLGNSGSLTKTGYSFTGWNTAANGSGSSYAPGATFTITGTTTLYAKWALIPDRDGDGVNDQDDAFPDDPALFELGINHVDYIRVDGGDLAANLVDGKPKFDVYYRFRATIDYRAAGSVWLLLNGYPQKMDCGPEPVDFSGLVDCSFDTLLGPAPSHHYRVEIRDNSAYNQALAPLVTSNDVPGPVIELLNGANMVGLAKDHTGSGQGVLDLLGSSTVHGWVSDGLTTDANKGHFVAYDNTYSAEPGRGYFLQRESNGYLPDLSSYPELAAASVTLALQPGWNLISNPYGGQLDLGALQVQRASEPPVSWLTACSERWLTNGMYHYSGNDWGSVYTFASAGGKPEAKLTPWVGYWIYLIMNDADYKLIIPKPIF